MFTSMGASTVILVLGIVLFIVLCFKGLHTGVAALASACVVALGTADFMDAIFTTFAGGIATFITNNMMAMFGAGFLSFVMLETGASQSIGNKLVELLGVHRAPFIIILGTIILQTAGIASYVFIMASLTYSLCEAANLPRRVGYTACVGAVPMVGFCFPVANIPNMLPCTFLGTTLYEVPVLSIATGLVGFVLFFIYMNYLIKKMEKEGRGYDGPKSKPLEAGESLPNFWLSLGAIVIVIVLACVLQLVVGLTPGQAITIAQFAGGFFCYFCNLGKVKEFGAIKMIGQGASSMFPFAVMAGCVLGFGSVTQQTACFDFLIEKIMGLQVNPYVTAFLSIALIAALCADGIGGMVMWLGVFGSQYAAMPDVNAGALHRLVVCTSSTLDSLPHSQAVATNMAVFGMELKDAYKDQFITTVIIPIIFSLFCLAGCIIFY